MTLKNIITEKKGDGQETAGVLPVYLDYLE
jgi:hypothetical protein